MGEVKKIVIISDSTGKTAKRLMDAVLGHYSQKDVEYSLVNIYHQIRERETLERALKEIDDESLVIFSIISEDLSQYLRRRLSERGILHLNILEPMLSTISKFLGTHPDYRPGILQIIDDKYYKKVDAIGYSAEHDDGRGQLIEEADVVLLGLSRTCKTPISMYLACNFGIQVANIPIVPDAIMEKNLLAKLAPLKQDIIFGLMMQPEVLAHVREERSLILARTTASRLEIEKYSDLSEIYLELRFCRNLFRQRGWHTIDVTRRAIEEISLEILGKLGHGR
jgi:regulator of PEP synthase PpsR (kinase-PPPase family)